MTKQSLLEKIRSAVVKVCPEIMRISFGCKVKFRTESGDSLILGKVAYVVRDCHIPWAGIFYDDSLEAKIDCKDLEIIGHPIGLPEILRTICESPSHNLRDDIGEDLKQLYNFTDETGIPYTIGDAILQLWDFESSFEDQKLETLHFILNLLK